MSDIQQEFKEFIYTRQRKERVLDESRTSIPIRRIEISDHMIDAFAYIWRVEIERQHHRQWFESQPFWYRWYYLTKMRIVRFYRMWG